MWRGIFCPPPPITPILSDWAESLVKHCKVWLTFIEFTSDRIFFLPKSGSTGKNFSLVPGLNPNEDQFPRLLFVISRLPWYCFARVSGTCAISSCQLGLTLTLPPPPMVLSESWTFHSCPFWVLSEKVGVKLTYTLQLQKLNLSLLCIVQLIQKSCPKKFRCSVYPPPKKLQKLVPWNSRDMQLTHDPIVLEGQKSQARAFWNTAKSQSSHFNQFPSWHLVLDQEQIYRPSKNTIEYYFHRETAVHILLEEAACSALHLTGSSANHQKIELVIFVHFWVLCKQVICKKKKLCGACSDLRKFSCSDLACSDLACSDLACSDLGCSDLAHSDLACSDLGCFFCQNSYFFHSIFTTWKLI